MCDASQTLSEVPSVKNQIQGRLYLHTQSTEGQNMSSPWQRGAQSTQKIEGRPD